MSAACAAAGTGTGTTGARIAVSANDNEIVLADGVMRPLSGAPPDTITILDIGAAPPKVLGEISGVPASVIGPPSSVAITPDEGLALVTASVRPDPKDSTKLTPDTQLTVIDLTAQPPAVLAKLETGRGAGGISINREGNLALVANRDDGTISILSIRGKEVALVGNLALDPKSGPSHVAITPNGKMALVTRATDHRISLLSIDGTTVAYGEQDLFAGLRPAALEMAPTGAWAVVGNMGLARGDEDTVSLIDLAAEPPRVTDTISVGQGPEGLAVAPDGKHVAVVVHNGSNKPGGSPFFSPHGLLVMLRVEGRRLVRVASVAIGPWSQGAVFSADGKTILVGSMIEKSYRAIEWDGSELRDSGSRVAVSGGAAAIRKADR